MKKKKTKARLMAMMLAVALMFTVSGITVFADGSTASGNSSGTASGNSAQSVSSNNPGMSATAVNRNGETVKTGEVDIVPFIIGFGLVAVAAGTGYVVYRKKHG